MQVNRIVFGSFGYVDVTISCPQNDDNTYGSDKFKGLQNIFRPDTNKDGYNIIKDYHDAIQLGCIMMRNESRMGINDDRIVEEVISPSENLSISTKKLGVVQKKEQREIEQEPLTVGLNCITMCNESGMEINDNQRVEEISSPYENPSTCTKGLDVIEQEQEVVETSFIHKERVLDTEGENVATLGESHSSEALQSERHEINDVSKTDQTNDVHHGKFNGQLRHKTTKREQDKAKQMKRNGRHRCEAHCGTDDKQRGSSSFDDITRSLFKMKSWKKTLILVILILNGLCPVTTAPTIQNPKTRELEEYGLLITRRCKYRDLIRAEKCHVNEKSLKKYIEFCGFAEQCDTNSEPICVNGENGGMLHICSQKNLICAKGYRRTAWLDNDTDVVYVKEEKCPQDRYQSIESSGIDCYHACSNKHLDLQHLPAKYSLFSKGDNISPTWIYCNFEKGFYNMDGKFLIAYDDKLKHYPYFCTDILEGNPCGDGEYPLPNKTCVSPCEEGRKRDAHDDFKCKIHSLSGVSTQINTVDVKVSEYRRTNYTTVALTSSTASVNSSEALTKKTENKEEKTVTFVLHDSTIAVIIAVTISLVFMMLIGVLVWCCKRNRKTVNVTNVTENNSFENAENVHIYQRNTGDKRDDTFDEVKRMPLIREGDDA